MGDRPVLRERDAFLAVVVGGPRVAVVEETSQASVVGTDVVGRMQVVKVERGRGVEDGGRLTIGLFLKTLISVSIDQAQELFFVRLGQLVQYVCYGDQRTRWRRRRLDGCCAT